MFRKRARDSFFRFWTLLFDSAIRELPFHGFEYILDEMCTLSKYARARRRLSRTPSSFLEDPRQSVPYGPAGYQILPRRIFFVSFASNRMPNSNRNEPSNVSTSYFISFERSIPFERLEIPKISGHRAKSFEFASRACFGTDRC